MQGYSIPSIRSHERISPGKDSTGRQGEDCLHLSKWVAVWPENLMGIQFDEIACKLHNKNMTDFNLTKYLVRRHIV